MTKPKSHYAARRKQQRHAEHLVKQLQSTQEQAEMERAQHANLHVASIWPVPDLTFRGYTYPNYTRQYVVTLSHAIHKKEFSQKVKHAFDVER